MSVKTYFIESNLAEYSAEELSWLQKIFLEEGVLGNGAGTIGLEATENAVPDMSVLVSAGNAIVDFTKNTVNWKVIAVNSAIVQVNIANNSSGVNRVDAIILRIDKDAEPNALKTNVGSIEVVLGDGATALSDGDIDTAVGGDGWLRLADITVVNGATEIETADISDERVQVKTNESIKLAPKSINFTVLAADPSDLVAGMLWYNSTSDTLNYYDGAFVHSLKANNSELYNPLYAEAQSSPNMTLKVSKGLCEFYNQTIVKYAGGNSSAFAVPSVNPRIDLLCLNSGGTLEIVQGAEAGSPVAPTYPDNKYVLCEVYNRVGETSIKNTSDGSNGYVYRDCRALYKPDANVCSVNLTATRNIENKEVVCVSANSSIEQSYAQIANSSIGGGVSSAADGTGFQKIASCRLTSKKFLQVAINGNYDHNIWGVNFEPSTDTASFSTILTTVAQIMSGIHIKEVDSSTAVLAYGENGGSWSVVAVQHNVASAPSLGAVKTLDTTYGSGNIKIVKLSDTKFIAMYCIDVNTIRFKYFTKSGLTLTIGGSVDVAFTEAGTTHLILGFHEIDATHALAYWHEQTTTTNRKEKFCIITEDGAGNLSASAVTDGATTASADTITDGDVKILDSDNSLAVVTSGKRLKVVGYNVGTGVITVGTNFVLTALQTKLYVQGKHFVTITYPSTQYIAIRDFYIADINTITALNAGVAVVNCGTTFASVCPLLQISPARTMLSVLYWNSAYYTRVQYLSHIDTNYNKVCGLADEDIVSAADGKVTLANIKKNMSGLSNGVTYYVDHGGGLFDNTGVDEKLDNLTRIGIALDTDELLIKY